MYTYLTRKLQMLFQFPYTDNSTMKKIIDEELIPIKELKLNVQLTRNPYFCLADSAEDINFDEQNNKIRVCTNLIPSEESLKGSLAREKHWILSIKQNPIATDDEATKYIIQSCKKEIQEFHNLDQTTSEEAAKLCSKIHTKLKLNNKNKFQVDIWHFYTRKLVDDNWYVYYT